MFGSQDLILIGIIVVVLFGSTKLPQLGSGIEVRQSGISKKAYLNLKK